MLDSYNGDADDCEGSGLGSGQDMAVVDEDPETRTGTISADCPAGAYTLRVSISSADNTELASASVAFTITVPCSGNPNPVGVDVEAVPIVVESTVEEYFVLYVRHDLDAYTTVELPVSVTLGADGTTSLAENVAALPKERYRVEKYNVADPADIDGDCIDDITELADPVGMNPVNPAPAIDISDGAVAVPGPCTKSRTCTISGWSAQKVGATMTGLVWFVCYHKEKKRINAMENQIQSRQPVPLGTLKGYLLLQELEESEFLNWNPEEDSFLEDDPEAKDAQCIVRIALCRPPSQLDN